MAWVIFLILVAPVLGLLAWLLFSGAVMLIKPGALGLVLVRGHATDRTLLPGRHLVPRLGKTLVQEYPSLELSLRASAVGSGGVPDTALEQTRPALRVALGDRTTVTLGYVVRFRLDRDRLRMVHERFGSEGLWAAVRDHTDRTLRSVLSDPAIGVDDVFGPARGVLEARLGEAVGSALDDDGITITMFALGELDLGRTGRVIEATARAWLELEREEAEAATRALRARVDAELESFLTTPSVVTALRYRELEVWRELVHTFEDQALVIPPPSQNIPTDDASEARRDEVTGLGDLSGEP